MPEDPPEEYRAQIEKAVLGALEDENVPVRGSKIGYTDEKAWLQIRIHLRDDFFESLKGKSVMPVPDDLFKLLQWAVERYSLELFHKLRAANVVKEHSAKEKGAS
jgi:hypothetical protein